jgi:hypothetical protein
MPYCENCGSQVSPNAKFCGSCGAARTPASPAPVESNPAEDKHLKAKYATKPATPKRERINYYSPPDPRYIPSAPLPIIGPQTSTFNAPTYQPTTYQATSPQNFTSNQPQPTPLHQLQQSGEATVGVVHFKRMKSMGRYDSFAGVVTTQRLIFAQITGDMVTAAAQQAREQAKAEGKGFFGQWADQLRGTFGYTNRYLTMAPDAILAETQGNFALYNSTINEIKIHLKNAHHEHNQQRHLEAEIFSSYGTYRYHMEENSEFTDLLKRVYGDRVKMPFGYFSKSVNIKI